MSKRRGASPPRKSPGKPSRSRRQTPRRPAEDNVRVAAAWVLERTLASRAPVDSFLSTVLERFDDRDQALLCQLVLGSLRWLGRIDDVLARASNRSLDDIETPLHPVLRIGAYQLLFLDRIPHHAAVNEAVEEASQRTHRGGANFVNAVLRRIARDASLDAWPVEVEDPAERMAIELSHPEFLVRRWLARFGESKTRALLEANNRPKALQLLAFADRGGREALGEALIDEGLEVEPTPLSPRGLTVLRGDPLATEAFERGDFYIQDEGSQAAALIPPPSAGDRVLDAAAAPGGKTFALMAQEPTLRAFAGDRAPDRAAVMASNLRRLRRTLPLAVADASAGSFRGTFDRVVMDLPCTGTGTLRKHPELKWRISEDEIGRLAQQGMAMLLGVADQVRSGGLLVAITCSLESEENEGVVAQFLERRNDFSPLSLEGELNAPLADGIDGPGLWRLLPGGNHDGFTVTVLERLGD